MHTTIFFFIDHFVIICYTVVISLPFIVRVHVHSIHACAYKGKWFIRLNIQEYV